MKIILIITFFLTLILGETFVKATNGQSPSSSQSFDYKHQPESFWTQKLQPEVFNICRARGTEKAGSGTYDKFYEKGTYMCACCGGDHPLYSSETKFDSHTGWPSFWDTFNPNSVTLQQDDRILSRLMGVRTEVLCGRCGSHLGHVFDDGPSEHTGKRYCMNSLALHFVPEGKTAQRTFSVD